MAFSVRRDLDDRSLIIRSVCHSEKESPIRKQKTSENKQFCSQFPECH